MRQYGNGDYYGVDKQGGLVVDTMSPFNAKCLQRDANGNYTIGTSAMTSAIFEDWGATQGTFEDNSITYEKDGETQTYVVENGTCTPTPPDFS